jgi:hypothetical protein
MRQCPVCAKKVAEIQVTFQNRRMGYTEIVDMKTHPESLAEINR